MKNWQGQRVLILGAARQGLALARFLIRQGADVTLNDQNTAEQMKNAIESMQGYPVHWVLGGHPLNLLDHTDMVCLSGGVPTTLPIVVEAQKRGIPLSNDSQIFMEAVPCRVIGITGSAGKTTTTTLVGRIAQAAIQPPAKSWVGGNIGLPLIDQLDKISANDTVILELSSFQLEQMTISPQVAAILNITPNHLDRHGTLAAYTAAKSRILDFQTGQDVAVLCRDDPGAWGLAERARGRLITFGWHCPPAGKPGTFLQNNAIFLSDGSQQYKIIERDDIQLRGDHNLLNVLAACAIAHAANFPISAMLTGIRGFTGVPHRLEYVRTLRGANWYNDSIATAPERTIAAIRSFQEPLVLLLGGRDKNLPWESLAELVHERVDHVVIFGEATQKILKALGQTKPGQRPFTIDCATGLREAIQIAAAVAEPGDIVLLSPGGTSFDEFRDFEERGERFREWVKQLT